MICCHFVKYVHCINSFPGSCTMYVQYLYQMYMYIYFLLFLSCSAGLEKEVVDREGRVRELEEALSSMDRELDSLRSDVDSKDEAIQQLKLQLTEEVCTLSGSLWMPGM